MSEQNGKKEFANKLLAQDPPSADKQLRHKEVILKKIERSMRLQKAVIIAIYIVIFDAAFGAFILRDYTDNVVHSICWGTVSLHILLWSLVYILRGLCMQMQEIMVKICGQDEISQHKIPLFITIVALLVFALATRALYRSFFFDDPLKAADTATDILWAPIAFLILYPFATASLNAKLWLQYKIMELNIPKTEEQNLKSQTE
jgi:hypothetical protein